MENIAEGITRRLKDFCAENKITQTALAKAVGLTHQAVQKWFDLRKSTLPDLTTLFMMAEEYDLDLNWLIRGENDKKYRLAPTKDCSDCAIPPMFKALIDDYAEKMEDITRYQKEENERIMDKYEANKIEENCASKNDTAQVNAQVCASTSPPYTQAEFERF